MPRLAVARRTNCRRHFIHGDPPQAYDQRRRSARGQTAAAASLFRGEQRRKRARSTHLRRCDSDADCINRQAGTSGPRFSGRCASNARTHICRKQGSVEQPSLAIFADNGGLCRGAQSVFGKGSLLDVSPLPLLYGHEVGMPASLILNQPRDFAHSKKDAGKARILLGIRLSSW